AHPHRGEAARSRRAVRVPGRPHPRARTADPPAGGERPRVTRRILLASRLFVPEVSAGAFRLGALAAALGRRGAEVTVVTSRPPRHAPPIADPPGVRVSRWPVLRDRGGNVRGYLQYASFDLPLPLRLLFRRFDAVV